MIGMYLNRFPVFAMQTRHIMSISLLKMSRASGMEASLLCIWFPAQSEPGSESAYDNVEKVKSVMRRALGFCCGYLWIAVAFSCSCPFSTKTPTQNPLRCRHGIWMDLDAFRSCDWFAACER